MKISLIPIGEIGTELIFSIGRGIAKRIPEAHIRIEEENLLVPREFYNHARRQYNSSLLLGMLKSMAERWRTDRVLGVTDVDLYVPRLNFVFGEAELMGRCCLISIFRLRPEFYGFQKNVELFTERCVKESIHELGHTLGLEHCVDSSCVMHFSLHIHSVDMKGPDFCVDCGGSLEEALEAVKERAE